MNNLLNNPAYYALLTGDTRLGTGTDKVRYFDKDVAPFASFEEGYLKGFDDLRDLLPAERLIVYPSPNTITEPPGWQLLDSVKGYQMVFDTALKIAPLTEAPLPLGPQHIEAMLRLTDLTKPGPFGTRTIEFGNYFGYFEGGELVAMAGERLHVDNFTEISAVCTHPDYLGRGLASALLRHQAQLISSNGQAPFLHVRADNERAIEIYKRLGFSIRSNMNFHVLKRQ